ncbi:MAG: hypothetical protein WCQ16_07420 [Verrucomicrobiae bacterium]
MPFPLRLTTQFERACQGSNQTGGEYLQAQTDGNGNRHVILPRLNPVDCYYLYNPDDYYRLAK